MQITDPASFYYLLERKRSFAAQVKKMYKTCYMFSCNRIVHSSKTLHVFRQCTSTSPSPKSQYQDSFLINDLTSKALVVSKILFQYFKSGARTSDIKVLFKILFQVPYISCTSLLFYKAINHRENPNPNIETKRQKHLKLH